MVEVKGSSKRSQREQRTMKSSGTKDLSVRQMDTTTFEASMGTMRRVSDRIEGFDEVDEGYRRVQRGRRSVSKSSTRLTECNEASVAFD